MDAIPQTAASQPASTAAPVTQTEAEADGDRISADFDNFLRMLTVQLENQDPLDPMDSDQFAMQLATFSGVEQAVKTNDLLTSLNSALSSQSLSDMSGWIGKEARVSAPLGYDGTPVTFYPEAPGFASSVDFVIKDADGAEQGRIAIADSDAPFQWAGQLSNGRTAGEGPYSFTVESRDVAGEVISTSTPEAYVPVVEAQNQSGAISLVLAGGTSVRSTDVLAIR